jgi:hypothetical protein
MTTAAASSERNDHVSTIGTYKTAYTNTDRTLDGLSAPRFSRTGRTATAIDQGNRVDACGPIVKPPYAKCTFKKLT